jgi:hypothetical protein
MTKQPPRYCGMCDVWVPARHLECPDCGAATDKALRGFSAEELDRLQLQSPKGESHTRER